MPSPPHRSSPHHPHSHPHHHLQELDRPEFGHYFVKRALATALDKHDREREMTSVLLSTLYNEVRYGSSTAAVRRRRRGCHRLQLLRRLPPTPHLACWCHAPSPGLPAAAHTAALASPAAPSPSLPR